MSRTTGCIMRIIQQLEKIKGLDGVVVGMLEREEQRINEIVFKTLGASDILEVQNEACFLQDRFPWLEWADCKIFAREHFEESELITGAYQSMRDAAGSEARLRGLVNSDNEKYFNWEVFEEDLRKEGSYIELPSRAVLHIDLSKIRN